MNSIGKWLKKSMRWSIALLLIAVLGIGLTLAYLTDVETAFNRFSVSEVQITTEETAEALTKKDIGVSAQGTSKCYVRMRVDIPDVTYPLEGQSEPGQAQITLANRTITGTQWQTFKGPVTAVLASGTAEWKKIGDFWYLSIPLKKGEKAYLINEITYPGLYDAEKEKMVSPLPDGLTEAMLSITVTSEAVQADGIDVGDESGAEAAFKAFQTVDP